MDRSEVPARDRPHPAQPNLFDVDDAALDTPVAFALTASGRRAVDPGATRLRLVGGREVVTPDAGSHEDGEVDPRTEDRRLVADLSHTDTWRHARVRALARAGTSIADIATDLDLSPAVVRVWVAEPSVPAALGGTGARSTAPALTPAEELVPADVQGLAVLATCGTIEPGAVVATTSRIGVATTVVVWLRARHGVTPGQVRVVLQVAERTTSDLVARAWADRLGLTPDRVSVVAWSRAPGPRAVQATVRVSGRDLSSRVGAQLDAWPLVDPATG